MFITINKEQQVLCVCVGINSHTRVAHQETSFRMGAIFYSHKVNSLTKYSHESDHDHVTEHRTRVSF